MTSYYGDVVHRARTPLYNHVGEFSHFYLSVVPLLHQVHDGQRGALRHRAPPLPVAVVTLGLLAASGAPEGLVACGLDDPVLRPGESTEVDEVLLPAAGVFILVDVAVATRTEEERIKKVRLLSQSPKQGDSGGPESLCYTPAHPNYPIVICTAFSN